MLLALALLLLQADPTPTRTLHVGPGREHASPASALAAAAAGDTVRLDAGVYAGPLRIDRPLTLVAAPGAAVDGGGRGTAVLVEADSVTIANLLVRNSGLSLNDDEAAIKLVGCTGCRVLGTVIERSLHGIYLLESRDVELRDNLVVGHAALPEARRGNGIHLFHSTGNRLRGNSVRGTRDGIYFSFASGNTVEENEVRGVRYGLHYMYSDDNVFRRNRFHQNAAGAAIMFSRRIVFRENVFARHVGHRAYGVLLQTAYEVHAERNRIEGNLVGVFLDMSSDNVFRENRIAGNGIGVDLIASAEQNTFVGNAFEANRTAVRKPNGAGRNSWAVDGRGNYWADRSVYDLDGDGVGDRPYQAADPFASQAALRPALELFSGTPAALALSWAERAFPVFDLPRVEDPAPLTAAPAGVPGVAQGEEPGAARGYGWLGLAAAAAGWFSRRAARRNPSPAEPR